MGQPMERVKSWVKAPGLGLVGEPPTGVMSLGPSGRYSQWELHTYAVRLVGHRAQPGEGLIPQTNGGRQHDRHNRGDVAVHRRGELVMTVTFKETQRLLETERAQMQAELEEIRAALLRIEQCIIAIERRLAEVCPPGGGLPNPGAWSWKPPDGNRDTHDVYP